MKGKGEDRKEEANEGTMLISTKSRVRAIQHTADLEKIRGDSRKHQAEGERGHGRRKWRKPEKGEGGEEGY